MVNAIFHDVVGEDVYKEEEDEKSSSQDILMTLDPDTQGSYMESVGRYMHFMVDELQEAACNFKSVARYKEILEALSAATWIMRRLVDGQAAETDIQIINQWEEKMSEW